MSEVNEPSSQPATASVAGSFHPLDESNLLVDFKVLLTKPRHFFEFFGHSERINHVVWAKVILVFLALGALNAMISTVSFPTHWSAEFEGLDPRISGQIHHGLQQLSLVAGQLFSSLAPFFTLAYTTLLAAFGLLTLRLLGANTQRLSWSGIFCVMIAAHWTTIFGFLPGVGAIAVAILPMVYTVVGLAQLAGLSKLRTFFGIYILPALIMSILFGMLTAVLVSLGVALFS
ncbi:MAG TPA: hypothetical protein VM901_09860 [Bdellovibrionota bacterium]|jgi:hypothetical protein|nr:hypothetical protein [Bdellovibrionota bacterium]